MCCNVFNVWPKTNLLLLVWPRDAQRLDTPGRRRGTSHSQHDKDLPLMLKQHKKNNIINKQSNHGKIQKYSKRSSVSNLFLAWYATRHIYFLFYKFPESSALPPTPHLIQTDCGLSLLHWRTGLDLRTARLQGGAKPRLSI